ncbi:MULTISPECIES: molybdate ABC transporter substrate-binding protein [unclassified Streptomyces]|uniref:molybdate ABC transporter substrate-binding protein n=1 Tax=unclassified Streptomyces TaxID=2593676 RepID=UPI000DD68BFF|nr:MULTISPECIES: molybdate ABC transporter substrate-binding protein [unclassified Streptomyces]QZZ26626.1 molybdate ABC transporter substrate-binding protein [Streptomyces sp. ST1015]
MTRPAPRPRRLLQVTGAGVAALLTLSACSSDSTPAPGTPPSASGKVSGTVTVFAAASLKETFTALGEQFEKAHPGTKVTFNFAGSDSLAASITSGAPADVFAAASAKTMAIVTGKKDNATTPVTFVRNQLEIATLPGNPDKVTGLKDLTRAGLKVVLCDRTVPCGAAADKILTATGVEVTPVSYEQDVKSALTKVELKEADAALVYKTDVHAAGTKVQGIDFPESSQAVNDYPITLLKDAPNAAAAKEFIALVQSPEGRKILTEAGFLQP